VSKSKIRNQNQELTQLSPENTRSRIWYADLFLKIPLFFLLNLRVNSTPKKKKQSAVCQVWLLVSLNFFVVFFVHFCNQYLLSNGQGNKRKKYIECLKSLSLQKVHDFRFGVRKLGFLVKRSARTCTGSAWQSAFFFLTVECLQISFLGLGSAKMICK